MIKRFNYFVNENKKENEEFAKKLLEIVDKENIKIEYKHGCYEFNVDNTNYCVCLRNELGIYYYTDIYINPNTANVQSITVPYKYGKQIRELYDKRFKDDDTTNKLPDLSDIGRSAKKYNL